MRRALVGLFSICLAAAPVAAAEFRWATTNDVATLDPHAQGDAPTLGFLANIYEGLVRRDPARRLEPALATSWEPLGGDGWRFHLRKGVTFHDGAAFDADDVLFSYRRAAAPQAGTASAFGSVREVVAADPYTIDFLTTAPDPVLPETIANFLIVDQGWAERNDAALPGGETANFATLNANGTGAFRVAVREPGVQTVLEPFANWWDEAAHNITRAVHKPIKNPATALASLISGAVDFIEPVPIEDVERLRGTVGVKVIEGSAARVIMLGFNHAARALSPGGDPNPFADRRVRLAVAMTVNVEAITSVIMRGTARPVDHVIDPAASGTRAARWPVDPGKARALLAEAGHANGFSFALACPKDLYIAGVAVCQAVAGMLAPIGLTANLEAMPHADYLQRLREGAFGMYLLGWSPDGLDAAAPIRSLAATHAAGARPETWNFGGYADPRIDAMLARIGSGSGETAPQALREAADAILLDAVAYIPLYLEPLLWGVRENVDVRQRADEFFLLNRVRVN